MRKVIVSVAAGVVLSAGVIALGVTPSGAHATCVGIGALETHGQHIIGDYVTGIGGISGDLTWPPEGGIVGETIGGNGGAVAPGTPGLPRHGGFAPGASFCNDSNSPGTHL